MNLWKRNRKGTAAGKSITLTRAGTFLHKYVWKGSGWSSLASQPAASCPSSVRKDGWWLRKTLLNRCRSGCCLPPASFYHDTAYINSSSCSGPRTAFGRRGVGWCGQPLSPSHTVAAVSSYTAHTADAPAGIPCWLSAISFRTRALQLTALLPGAVLCAFHNISVRRGQEPHIRDVCTVCLVYMALLSPPIKNRPLFSFFVHFFFQTGRFHF